MNVRGPAARRCADDRGTVLVESALIFPLLFTMLLGVLEYALVFRSYLTLGNGQRATGRMAAIEGNDSDADWQILQAAKREMAAISNTTITRIVIFNATPTSAGAGPLAVPAACQTGARGPNATAKCNVYIPASEWATTAKVTDYGCNLILPNTNNLAAGYCPANRNISVTGTGRTPAVAGQGPDIVGIYTEIKHTYLTKIFGNFKTLSDTQYAAIEPRTS
jgi:Flp pilus assembly protein TadG